MASNKDKQADTLEWDSRNYGN